MRLVLAVSLVLLALAPLEARPLTGLSQATFSTAPARAAVGGHATVIFGGDMMFDRSVRAVMDQKGGDFIFSCIDPTLQSADLVIANLEGPITPNDSQSLGSAVGSPQNFVFTFSLSTAVLLAAHHIEAVNLGNNHIMNFGASGVRSTTDALNVAQVHYFGDPLKQAVAHVSRGGVALALINYNEFSSGSTASTTIAQIRAARAAGELPVVYTHWGIEYATTSPQYVRDLAHRFVDAGAGLVVGSHPHVVEEHEVYRGTYIYYSLGNFIFDQYWNDDVTHGLLLEAVFTPAGVADIREIPVVLARDRRTCVVQ